MDALIVTGRGTDAVVDACRSAWAEEDKEVKEMEAKDREKAAQMKAADQAKRVDAIREWQETKHQTTMSILR